jgi:hypothetical protein
MSVQGSRQGQEPESSCRNPLFAGAQASMVHLIDADSQAWSSPTSAINSASHHYQEASESSLYSQLSSYLSCTAIFVSIIAVSYQLNFVVLDTRAD